MTEGDLEVRIRIPGQWTHAPLPFHGVGTYSVDWTQSHLVELALCGHAFNIKGESLPVADALHTEVKPSVEVTSRGVWQTISTHPAGEAVLSAAFIWITLAQVA